MWQNTDLNDLLNGDAAAYEYFYALSPQAQEKLWGLGIRTMDDLQREAENLSFEDRPQVF